MNYEDDAEEHERLAQRRFALLRKYEALPPERFEERALLREAIAELTEELDKLRRRHR